MNKKLYFFSSDGLPSYKNKFLIYEVPNGEFHFYKMRFVYLNKYFQQKMDLYLGYRYNPDFTLLMINLQDY